ncbi:MAG: hypothetical protein FLDDKLPJ_02137 [Phycisphaerae bacterium]|nr:hypothetical protein [Phycisphaerae bacterium]
MSAMPVENNLTLLTAGSRAPLLGTTILILATAAVFSGALGHDFVNYDDDVVVTDNPHIRDLTAANLRWMFTESRAGHYHPLTWLSLALDYRVWNGLDPFGFHLTNLLLHVATVVGFYLVVRRVLLLAGSNSLRRRSGSVEPPDVATELAALIAAAAFAVHPLRVESVAWVTERRDVLSGALLMPAIVLYLRAVSSPSPRGYRLQLAASILLYVLSLLSKAWGITLPAVLLMLNVYPLARLRRSPDSAVAAERRRVMLELAMYTLPAAAFAVAAIAAQHSVGALQPLNESYSVGMRLQQSAFGLGFYLLKTLAPVSLVPFYGWPEDRAQMLPKTLISVAAMILLGGVAWRARRRFPALATAAVCYAVLVSPVLGLTQSGPQLAADRYTYIPCLPWMIALAAFIAHLLRRNGAFGRRLVLSVALLGLLALGALTTRQVGRWRDSLTLWSYHLSRRPECPIGHVNYGSALFAESGREKDLHSPRRISLVEEAMSHYRAASQLRPGYVLSVRGVGRCLRAVERYEEALTWFNEALALREDDDETLFDIADTLAVLGRPEEALPLYRRIAALGGKHAYDAQYELGRILHLTGRSAEAVEAFRAALRLRDDDATCHQALAESLLVLGQDAAAATELEAARRLSPSDPLIEARLAFVLATSADEAARDPDRALRLAQAAFDRWRASDPEPSDLGVEFHEALAAAQAASGQPAQAAETLDRVITRAPKNKTPKWLTRLSEQQRRYRSASAVTP